MKQYKNKKDLQVHLLNGSRLLRDYVSSTLGPKGRTVSLTQKNGTTLITKDGVTVANFLESQDPFENIAIRILRQASQKTCDESGDGTTTTTLLASQLFEQCLVYLESNKHLSPVQIKESLEKDIVWCIEQIKDKSIKVRTKEDIVNIASVSANGDSEIGQLVCEAIEQAGYYGSILIEQSKSSKTSMEYAEGFRFDAGYLTEKLVTNQDRSTIFYGGPDEEPPFVLVTDHRFGSNKDDLLCYEFALRASRPLIVIAADYDIDGPAVGAAIHSFGLGKVKIALIKAPRFGEEKLRILDDICIATGATLISKATGLTLKDVKLEHFGKCKKFESTKTRTVLGDCFGDSKLVQKRIEGIQSQIKESESPQEVERLQERIGRLTAGVVILRVGGQTEAEMIERKHRIEDSLGAVKSAQSYGIIQGGAVSYTDLSKQTKNPILKLVLRQPFLKLAENAGLNGHELINKIKNNRGFNFKTNKFENLFDSGVIEPAQVVISSLSNALSAAMMLLMTDSAIIDAS